jgi:hypothetical protein
MNDSDPTVERQPPQFLADMAAFLVRQANLAAFPYWEGLEIRFEARPEPGGAAPGVRLIARLRAGDRFLGERRFEMEELRDSRSLPGHVETWVQSLPADEKSPDRRV